MRNFRAAVRLVRFFFSTFGNYGVLLAASPFVRDRLRFRRRIFARWTQAFARITGMKLVVNGKPPEPPFFLVANHLGYVDIAALRIAVEGVFVAKAEIRSWPFVGRIVASIGTVFIDRQNRRDIPRAGSEIIERLDEGEGVIVFPEGTSTKGEAVIAFNSSFLQFAAARHIPVSYAAITYLMPGGRLSANQAICWWEDIGFFAHLWRLLKEKEYTAVVTFGDAPIENSNRKELAKQLHDRVTSIFTPVL
ncbi:MAG: 1-acyl-sn-glycerol-3-phosphate acyltransferase [Chloracidobacterium sp.]|nr:1-acyl-sn-glycerol-3-phosphate acyltransferase [Chloracidobacterium sp.]